MAQVTPPPPAPAPRRLCDAFNDLPDHIVQPDVVATMKGLGVGPYALANMIRDGRFPRPIRFSKYKPVFRKREIVAALDEIEAQAEAGT